jgi:Ca2+-binding RTX toxin-like protein
MTVLTVDQILDGPTLGLNTGLADLLVLEAGGRRILYALSRAESILVEIDIAANGSLSVAGSTSLTGTFPAGSTPLLGALADGSALTLAGLPAASGQTLTLSSTGTLGTQTALPALGALGAPVAFDLAGTPALVTATTSALTLATDTGGGYAAAATLADAADRYLAGVVAGTGFAIGANHYIATVSQTENGVNIAFVTASGLAQTGALGPAEGLPIHLPQDIAVMQRLGETLLAVASAGTSSLSIVRVAGGVPQLADHILDAAWTRFAGASEAAAVTYGDFAFVGAGGAEGGVSLLTVLPGGRLIHLASVAESETVPLARLSALDMTVAGSTLNILAGSGTEAGIARLTYDLSPLGAVVRADGTGAPVAGTFGNDQLIGSDVAEAISGGAGDDILFDRAGSDTLTGGAGADLFVFAADGQADTITDFERAIDRLDLSAFDFLYDVSQLSIAPHATGAMLTHLGETINVTAADLLPLTAADFTTAGILNVDRPSFLPIGQSLNGSLGDDVLIGGFGADTILGYAGDDSLSGLSGDDILEGGGGLDTLDGGAGTDTLRGHADADTLIGGAGDDLLDGGGGDDVLYGDAWTGG